MSTAPTKNRTAFYVFLALGILIAAGLIYLFFFKDKGCDPTRNGYNKKGELDSKCKVEDPKTTNEPAPTGSSGWISDATFPIKKGSWGPRVRSIQKALGFPDGDCKKCADGKFYDYTEDTLFAKTGKREVSTQAELDALINPSTTGGGSNFGQLKEALKNRATNISDGIRTYEQGINQNFRLDFFTNGRVFIYDYSNKEVARGTYSNGGKKIVLDGGKGSSNTDSVYTTISSIIKKVE